MVSAMKGAPTTVEIESGFSLPGMTSDMKLNRFMESQA